MIRIFLDGAITPVAITGEQAVTILLMILKKFS